MGGGEGTLSIVNRGNNEFEGEETERPHRRAFVGVVKTMGGEETLEHSNDTGKHRVVAVVASRRGQGRSNNEVEGEEVERPRTQAFVRVVAESPGGEEMLEHGKDMGEHRVLAAAASRRGRGQGQGRGRGQGQGQYSLWPGTGTPIGRGQGQYSLWLGTGTPIGRGVTEANKLQPTTYDDEVGGKVDGKVDEKVDDGKVDGKVDRTKQYSIHRFIISDTGTIGVNLTWLPHARKCLISTVLADSIAQRVGVEVGDEILEPPNLTSGVESSNVYKLFQTASKHHPILFEIKCKYKPPTNKTKILLPGCNSLHRFTINKSGPLGIKLEIVNSETVQIKVVTPDSLGDIYGLRENYILCKPLENGALEKVNPNLSKCSLPLVIEV
jgi:hypothetical protein